MRGAIQQGLDRPIGEWEGVDEIVRLARKREATR